MSLKILCEILNRQEQQLGLDTKISIVKMVCGQTLMERTSQILLILLELVCHQLTLFSRKEKKTRKFCPLNKHHRNIKQYALNDGFCTGAYVENNIKLVIYLRYGPCIKHSHLNKDYFLNFDVC